MSFTVIGLIWGILLLISLFAGMENTIILMMVSLVFQSTPFIKFGDDRIGIFEFCCLIFIIRYLINIHKIKKIKFSGMLLIFAIYAFFSSIMAAVMFQGTVIPHYGSFNAVNYLDSESTLGLSLSLYILIIRLLIYVITVYLVTSYCQFYPEKAKRIIDISLKISAIIVLSVGIIQFLNTLNIINANAFMRIIHDESISENDAYYKGYLKLYSTFREPSYCGPYLNALLWSILILKKKSTEKIIATIIVGIEEILTISSTAIISFIIMLLLYVLVSKKSKRNFSRIIGIIIVCVIAIFALPSGRQLIVELFTKTDSSSGVLRFTYIKMCYEYFLKTFGFGVGLQQVQSMTLISGLLGQTGILGCLLFLIAIYYMFKNKKQFVFERVGLCFFLSTLISTEISCSGIISAYPLWIGILLYSCDYFRISESRNC